MFGIPFLEGALARLARRHHLDDWVDRLNYFATPSILIFFTLMVSAKQYVGSPIQCWAPMEMKGGWEEYIESFCFSSNTYYVPLEDALPEGTREREQTELLYYQWVPIVLALQALFFYLPNVVWKSLNKRCGVDLATTVNDARNLCSLSGESRRTELEKLINYLADVIVLRRTMDGGRFIRLYYIIRDFVSKTSLVYLLTKILYLVNLVCQILLLDRFLGAGDPFWGYKLMRDLFAGKEWHETGMFPRVTMCDVPIKKIGNLVRYTVQCNLMINMFNEKIYIFLWMWFMLVILLTALNVVDYLFHMLPCRRNATVKDWLSGIFIDESMSVSDEKMITLFAEDGLRCDGILALRFIDAHAGSMVAREIAVALYRKFLESQHKLDRPIPSLLTSSKDGLEDSEVHHHADDPEIIAAKKLDGKTFAESPV